MTNIKKFEYLIKDQSMPNILYTINKLVASSSISCVLSCPTPKGISGNEFFCTHTCLVNSKHANSISGPIDLFTARQKYPELFI